MTTYLKQLLILLCFTPVYVSHTQPLLKLAVPAQIIELANVASRQWNAPSFDGEEANVFYLTAQLSFQFYRALSMESRMSPGRRHASYYWGQFPDTAAWQQRAKALMFHDWRAAVDNQLSLEQSAQSQVIYVREGEKGDGSSWDRAMADLQDALAKVKPGQEIWVARGVYYPTRGSDRYRSFVIPDSVRLYGGFAGDEYRRDDRDWKTNLTILSGEIGGEGLQDNSFTVVYTESVGAHTLVDGFVITGGFADGVDELGDRRRGGGGWYNNGGQGSSSPTVANCLFIHNYAREGAGFYNFAADSANPLFTDCQFVNNQADLDGGALFLDSRSGTAEVKIDRCLFSDNRANFGAAISNRSEGGQSVLLLERSAFESNTAYVRKLIHNGNDGGEENFMLLQRATRFADNISVVGEDENTPHTQGQGKKLKRGEIAFLTF